jgi:hypothetical protein
VENSDFYGIIIQTVYMPGTAGKKHLSEFSGMAKQPFSKRPRPGKWIVPSET